MVVSCVAETEIAVVVLATVTVTFCGGLVLGGSFVSPRYFAVSVYVPVGVSAEVENIALAVAVAELGASVAEPSTDVPFRNCTVPVGVALVAPTTVPVSVRLWPSGTEEDERDSVVEPLLATTRVTGLLLAAGAIVLPV